MKPLILCNKTLSIQKVEKLVGIIVLIIFILLPIDASLKSKNTEVSCYKFNFNSSCCYCKGNVNLI